MKKSNLLSRGLFILLFTLCTSLTYAQEQEVYNLRFDNPNINEEEKFCVTLQIKSASEDFVPGGYTFFFNYNPVAINDPVYNSLGFESRGEEYLEDGIPHTAMLRKSSKY